MTRYNFLSERWDKNSLLTQSDSISIVNAIPDDWQSITADLHASGSLLVKGVISPGVIVRIVGPKDDSKNSYSLGYCPCLSRFPDDKGFKGFCSFYKGEFEDLKTESMDEMLMQNKMPCGLFLADAGRNTHKDDIKDKKQLLKNFLENGYSLGTLGAERGSYHELIGRERTEFPLSWETERFFLNTRDAGLPFAVLHWDSKMGNYDNLASFSELIEKLGFKKEQND